MGNRATEQAPETERTPGQEEATIEENFKEASEESFKEDTEEALRAKVQAIIETFDGEEETFTPEEALTAICIEAIERGESFTGETLYELLVIMGLESHWQDAQAVADDVSADFEAQDGYHPTDRELSENDPYDDFEADFDADFEASGEVDFDDGAES